MKKAEDERMLAAFEKRKKDNEGKQINNSMLYAGSPMYFYCRHCGVKTDVLPESYITTPKTVCDDCKIMVDKGIMP